MFSTTLIKFEKSWVGTRSMTINNKITFFIGTSDRWGFEVSYTSYDRVLNFLIIHWYVGIEKAWSNE